LKGVLPVCFSFPFICPSSFLSFLHLFKVFAAEGLRTLVLAYRPLSAKEASDWCAEWKRATEATSDRSGALEKAAATIEKDLLVNKIIVWTDFSFLSSLVPFFLASSSFFANNSPQMQPSP